MKIIKIVFFTLLALSLIICTGIFIFFETFDTDQYLPQITKKASLVLGRQVSIGHVGLGLSSRGITLDAGPVSIADDGAFTIEPFIQVDRIRVSLDLNSLILRREIHITNILLQSPQIHFIRSREGNVNVRSIGQSSAQRPMGSDVVNPLPEGIIAKSAKPRLGGPVSTSAALKSASRSDAIPNIELQDAAVSFIDQNQAMPLDIWLSNINVSLKGASSSKPFPVSLDASLYSNTPNVHLTALVSLDLTTKSVQISDLKLNMDLSHLDMDQLNDVSPDSSIFKNTSGLVQLNMDNLQMDASGNIEGNGDINITNGVIRHFNIVKTVLSQSLGVFGDLDENINNLLNGQLKDKLGTDDTLLNKIQAKFSFHNKVFTIDDSLIQTNLLELTAKGSVDQGLNTDMQTMLHLNADVSTALVNEFGGFKLLCDDSQRIAIGASLKGVIPHLKYKLDKDFRKKSKKALMQEGGNILGALLGGGPISQDQDTSSKDTSKKIQKRFKNIFKELLQ